jgi:hypothetical protein
MTQASTTLIHRYAVGHCCRPNLRLRHVHGDPLGFRPVKYLSNIRAVTAVNRMSLGNAASPMQPHATRTSRGAPQARNLRAFACK